jgi:hypothetical protein
MVKELHGEYFSISLCFKTFCSWIEESHKDSCNNIAILVAFMFWIEKSRILRVRLQWSSQQNRKIVYLLVGIWVFFSQKKKTLILDYVVRLQILILDRKEAFKL